MITVFSCRTTTTQPGDQIDASPAFRAEGLTKVYRMGEVEVHALRGVDLELYAGEFVVILGPSGSGKSTLLNILGGLDVPTTGTVTYRHHNLTGADERELTRFRREHVGFIFQFYNLVAGLTAVQNVALVTDIADNPMDPVEALRMVDLYDRKDHYPAQLSGGEQQRVAIARAIGKRPDVLLCDEPTGALDVKTGIVVLEAIARINRELGTLTAVITHNASIAEMADRVVYLSNGSIAKIVRQRRQETRNRTGLVKGTEDVMRPLNQLLLSDLKRMWRQCVAISILLACGIATFVMSTSAMRSIEKSQARYYSDYHFGDVFVQLTRAPTGLANRLAEIPGVQRVETRIVRSVILDVPDMAEPATGQLVSIGPDPANSLNGIVLLRGRLPNPEGRTEVLASEPFADAHGFQAGRPT